MIGFVVWLGTKAVNDSKLTLWFGLASATLAPTGVGLILEFFRSREARVLHDLSKIREIEDLVNQATTKEEEVRALEEARTHLAEIVGIEARRQTIRARHELLTDDAARILEELRNLESAAASLDLEAQESPIAPELAALEERLAARRRGDYVVGLGSRDVVVPRFLVRSVPFYGRFLADYLDWYVDRLPRDRKQREPSPSQSAEDTSREEKMADKERNEHDVGREE